MQMDAHSLSVEIAPVILHLKGDTRADIYNHFFYTSKDPSATMEQALNQNTLVDYLGKFWNSTCMDKLWGVGDYLYFIPTTYHIYEINHLQLYELFVKMNLNFKLWQLG